MSLKVSRRGQSVPAFLALEILAKARAMAAAGDDVLHLEAGQPSKGAPRCVLEDLQQILITKPQGYTEACGLPELRAAIAAFYDTRYGLKVNPSQVVVTMGASGAFILSFLAAFDAGDRVAMATPGYPAYRNILKALDLVPVELPSDHAHAFQPTLEMLQALPTPPDGLIIASPSNPAGTVMPPDELAKILVYCQEKGIRVLSDEIYHGITYGAATKSALSFTQDSIVINSFSKYFALTGWRLGWMIVPDDLIERVTALAQNLFISPPTMSQYAGLASLQSAEGLAELDGYVAGYAHNRRLLLDGLPHCGFGPLSPVEGGFYIYADVSPLTDNSIDFCARLLKQERVALTPGFDFDAARGHRYVRISFSGSATEMEKALERLHRFSAS